MEPVSELLKKIPVLALLGENERTQLALTAIRKQYERLEYVAHCGEVWPYMAILEEGLINVVKFSSEGRNLGARSL